MGYTHYWYRTREIEYSIYQYIVIDMKKICKKSGIAIGDGNGEGEPFFTDEHVVFNGYGDAEAYETFAFPRNMFVVKGELEPDNNLYIEFCKTAQHDYDLCVAACLVVAKHYLKDKIEVGCDGGEYGFDEAKDLCQEHLGYGGDFETGKDEDE